jgi:hypothetical protein
LESEGSAGNHSNARKNVKRYLSGALLEAKGRVLWVEWERKNTDIFLLMMAELRRQYRRAKRLNFFLDNYRIHKSHKVAMFLKQNPKFRYYFSQHIIPGSTGLNCFGKSFTIS